MTGLLFSCFKFFHVGRTGQTNVCCLSLSLSLDPQNWFSWNQQSTSDVVNRNYCCKRHSKALPDCQIKVFIKNFNTVHLLQYLWFDFHFCSLLCLFTNKYLFASVNLHTWSKCQSKLYTLPSVFTNGELLQITFVYNSGWRRRVRKVADAGVIKDLNSFSCLFYGLGRLFKDRSNAQIPFSSLIVYFYAGGNTWGYTKMKRGEKRSAKGGNT